MIRFAVILYFFVHLAVMLKAPHLKWASRVLGYGTALFFLALVAFSTEPNSNFVFIVTAAFAAIGVFAAEIVASLFKKPSDSA
jgi:hypothetical protein